MSLLDAFRGGATLELPLVYTREAVVFPKSIAPLLAATKFSIAAVDEAFGGDKRVVTALLKGLGDEKGSEIEVHPIGTVARIIQQVRLPDGSIRLLVEGEARVRIKRTLFRKDHLSASIEALDDEVPRPKSEGGVERDGELDASLRLVKRSFAAYADGVKKIPPEVLAQAERAEKPHELCDLIANSLPIKPERKQALLGVEDGLERLEAVEAAIEGETELANLQRKISAKVKNRIDRNQREYFLGEQLKEINRELGKDGEESEVKELERSLMAKDPPEEVLAKAKRELSRLGKLQAFSPEAGVLRVYCEWLADLPWSTRSKDNRDIERARKALDEDHYGMEKPKERILEFIAVRQLSDRARGPILCLVGPPGTGKTSLGRSVARALERSFVRVSLGGLRDEAEIRGHRKTYVGALPGKIIQSIRKAGTNNPVFLLDEVDKMSSDFRGDPASALLEVLDPEQNSSFTDHYLELAFDLSNVMFITTANSLHGIPYPLLDRMEVIEVPGYSEYEKLEIAKKFLVPKQLSENGLGGAAIKFRDAALLEIIRHYTMESGVRSLEREIARVVRKLAQEAVKKGFAAEPAKLAGWSAAVTEKKAASLLGKRRREDDVIFKEPRSGVAYGLAWTEAGGTLLPVEALVFYLRILGSGKEFGAKFTYEIQEKPEGLPQAFTIGDTFIGTSDVALILGDNIFTDDFSEHIKNFRGGAHIFAKKVPDPERMGVVRFDGHGRAVEIVEKPKAFVSGYAIPGMYLYDSRVVDVAKHLAPSDRGELEIVDVHRWYMERGELAVSVINGEWIDAGTFESLFRANRMAHDLAMANAQKGKL